VNVVLNVILLSAAAVSILAALYFVMKAVGARSNIHRQAYNVGQAEARRDGQVNGLRAVMFFVVGLIFLGIFVVKPLVSRVVTSPEPTPTVPAVVVPTKPPVVATLPVLESTIAPTPSGPEPSPSPELTAVPTATTAPVTATVSSGVGVWLRGAPSTTGEQLEWLLDGTVVTLLAGQETADDLLWQQVRTEAGVEGWVARDFLSTAEPTP